MIKKIQFIMVQSYKAKNHFYSQSVGNFFISVDHLPQYISH